MDETWAMLLRMTAATLLYVLITAVLWIFCQKKQAVSNRLKAAVGLIYGACSVAANHIGIDYGGLIMNVRDIGPLAAGLFFSPVSGVIAGAVGGAERILAGELWGIGTFTEAACGMSTFLAGVLAAVLNRAAFRGEKPPVTQAFFIGAVMEVFHMYAILFTNRKQMVAAYYAVKTTAVPMILFTAVGLAACTVVIKRLSREPLHFGWKMQEEKTPIYVLFQRSLLAVIAALFFFNLFVSYVFQTRLTAENTQYELEHISYTNAIYYDTNRDIEALEKHLEEQQDSSVLFILARTEDGKVLYHSGYENIEYVDAEDMEAFRENQDVEQFVTELKTYKESPGTHAVFFRLDDDYFLVALRPGYMMYESRDAQMYENTLSDILLFTVLYILVARLVEGLVVRNLHRVNASLNRITNGHLDEPVWVHTSAEFTELSEDINQTVTALKGYISQAEQRMKEELELAAAIQDSALPKTFVLPSKNIELYALMTPAKQVGGDFYDFFYIDANRLCLVIADVSGKGVPASLFMMRSKTAIKNYARSGNHAAELLKNVNAVLCEGNDADMFVTVWIGILDLATGTMQCANAGHEYPVVMCADDEYKLLKDRHGMVLAALESIPIMEYEIQMSPGDRLFVYTDGVPEAINEKEEAYGTERMVDRLNRLRNASQERILEGVLQDIRNFAGSAEQFDDITMLGLTFLDYGRQP